MDEVGNKLIVLICSLTKYTTAGTILGEVLKKFIPTIQAGKSVLDLCTE